MAHAPEVFSKKRGQLSMQIQIESTDQITMFEGVPCRVWEGVTADGVPCKVFVHRIAVETSVDMTQFDQQLKEQLPPGRFVPLSVIL